MILPLMNVTVIPLLLGAVVPIRDHAEWNLGPEYVFHLNKTLKIYMNILITEDVTAVLKCRPKVSIQSAECVLSCNARKTISSSIRQRFYKSNEDQKLSPSIETKNIPNRFFEVKFGIKGVQGFKVTGRQLDPNFYDVIPDVIEQFHMDTDLMGIKAGSSMKNYEDKASEKHVISSFIQTNEDTMRASKCNTTWIIEYTPSNHTHKNGKHKNETKSSVYLKLLPMSYTNPADKTFFIQRTRIACTYQPKNIIFLNERWKVSDMDQYFNIMEIRSTKPKFRSSTHLEGNVIVPRKNGERYYFSENVHLELLRIIPAQLKELPV